MKSKKSLCFLFICTVAGLLCMGCSQQTAVKPLSGTIDAPLPADSMPPHILQAAQSASKFHCYDLMSDEAEAIAVTCIGEVDQTPTEGYGIVVTRGATTTNFLHLRNSRAPQAKFDAATGILWLSTSAIEGTGVCVEKLHQIRFDQTGKAYISFTVNPYDVQQALLRRLGYTIEGNQIALYDGKKLLHTATNTVTDMGSFDQEQPLWIGEQIRYDLSGTTPKVVFTPGVKYTTGLVLTYDDMPDFAAPISIAEDSTITIHDIKVAPTH